MTHRTPLTSEQRAELRRLAEFEQSEGCDRRELREMAAAVPALLDENEALTAKVALLRSDYANLVDGTTKWQSVADENDALRAMLREVEWSGSTADGEPACPSCGAERPWSEETIAATLPRYPEAQRDQLAAGWRKGHNDACRLAPFLKE